MKINEKGQYFSIDLLIAAGLAVLAMGLLLQFYELGSHQQKEITSQSELTLIGITASNILLEQSPCELLANFTNQKGYKVMGCADKTKFDTITKSELMIPDGYGCSIVWGLPTTSDIHGECNGTVSDEISNVVSIERTYFTPQGEITKENYENCIDAVICTGYNLNEKLEVKIWKEV
ncbi:MAG: hypothetical protein COV47_04395 [Candidatus Diapherotrites archaeon CG11_big_fil_rev_8_21_14_0_20_37_9]|nr:MAG: hypothetical protein COV47_04395 [Candidatus Diapherotrites archaeon CG11_big_fil_rev_8_21_14_0_20_37_9]